MYLLHTSSLPHWFGLRYMFYFKTIHNFQLYKGNLNMGVVKKIMHVLILCYTCVKKQVLVPFVLFVTSTNLNLRSLRCKHWKCKDTILFVRFLLLTPFGVAEDCVWPLGGSTVGVREVETLINIYLYKERIWSCHYSPIFG